MKINVWEGKEGKGINQPTPPQETLFLRSPSPTHTGWEHVVGESYADPPVISPCSCYLESSLVVVAEEKDSGLE